MAIIKGSPNAINTNVCLYVYMSVYVWAQQFRWRFCSQGQLSASSGAAFLMKRGKIKDVHSLTSKCCRFLAPPSALATGIISLSLVSSTLCLSLSSGTCEACMREWVLTSETDVTSGRAGTVTCQPLSCLRQCWLKWIRKSLMGILREITCSSARAAVCPKCTFKRSEK